MTRRCSILALALMELGGCGSDDEQQIDERPAATREAAATAKRPASQPTTAAPPEQQDTPSQRAEALRNCRGQARSTTSLSATARRRAKRICDAAAGRSAAQIKRAAREACIVVVRDTTRNRSSERASKLENCGLIL